MQRTLAGIFFLIAAAMLSIALGAWWLQRVALTPTNGQGATRAILHDDEVRAELTAVITAATAGPMDRPFAEHAEFVDQLIGSRPGAEVMTDIVAAGHSRAIGSHDGPVQITGPQLVEIVRNQIVNDLPPVTVPVAEVSTLRILAASLGWVAAVTAIIGGVALLAGVAVRPERGEVARAIGELCLAMAASLVVFGLLTPIFVLPAINDTTWMATVPRLAIRTLPVVLAAVAALAGFGLFMLLKALSSGRRKQWSTPLAVGRYREDRSWS